MDPLVFNGVDGATGEYLLPELTVEEVSAIAKGEDFDPDEIKELKRRRQRADMVHLGVAEGIDPTKLGQAGWGVVFAFADDEVDAKKEALKPLLDLRREQAGDTFYRECVGPTAFRPGDSKSKFLARHGAAPGQPADPEKFPYYVLLVGDPAAIPYRIQYQLGVEYAVGRLHFDALEDYASYAESVVAAEKGELQRSRSATYFGVKNNADRATQLSARELVKPLAQLAGDDQPNWQIDSIVDGEATRANLEGTLAAGGGRPSFLFTASHGVGFPNGDPRQLAHQGGLVCSDWPGPFGGGISEDHYFSGAHLAADADVAGLVAFHFACYGAGTPKLDNFAHQDGVRKEIAPSPFVASLPKALLKAGGLAAIGHVERAWGFSFAWPGAGTQLGVFESALKRLYEGHPVGSAMEYFSDRYASLSALLTDELENIEFGADPDDQELAGMWTANNDARSYVIVGDPAVRLCPEA